VAGSVAAVIVISRFHFAAAIIFTYARHIRPHIDAAITAADYATRYAAIDATPR